MMYEWDEAKNRSNLAKHGLDFADAEQVLTGPAPGGRPRHADYLHEKSKST